MRHDKISVIIPTYNEKEPLLRKAIDSILNQTYENIELIVIDDGSTDATPEILRSYGKSIKIFRRERTSSFRSVSEAFNIGLENANGFFWHHSAADCWHEIDWAERCIDFLAGREDEVLGVYTDFSIHDYNGQIRQINVGARYNPNKSSFENFRLYESLGGRLIRMDIARKAGWWDIRFPRKQTREWTLRVLQQGDFEYLPVTLWHFVFHEPDQMKRNASIKYRILCDLKNGYNLEHNVRIASGSVCGRWAMIDAFREFFTSPVWEKERLEGKTKQLLDDAKKVCDEEASEEWNRT